MGRRPGSRRASTRFSACSHRSTNGSRKKRSNRRQSPSGCRRWPTKRCTKRPRTSNRSAGIEIEKNILLQTLDHFWKEHLSTLDALRAVIHLRSYAQKKPIDEYKQEAFLLFERLLIAIREDVTRVLMRAQVQLEPLPPPVLPDFITQHIDPFSGDDDSADMDFATGAILSEPAAAQHSATGHAAGCEGEPPKRRSAAMRRARAGRARKYKHCHGQLA